MKRAAPLILLVLAVFVPGRATAHRLDEYLQQTLIELEPSRVLLHVSLTPGIEVADVVLQTIDLDHDGALSDAEKTAHPEAVRRDLSLSLDKIPMPLRLVGTAYPEVDAMRQGVGGIELTFEASPPAGLRTGTLHFENHHAATGSVFLVNALLSKAAMIHVGKQKRNQNQSTYDVAIEVDGTTSSAGLHRWLEILGGAILACALAIVAVRLRRRRRA